MTNNDPGHLNNLDEQQKKKLKEFWSKLIENLTDEPMNDGSIKINRNQLMLTIANDHPDILVLRWIRARKWNIDQAFQQFYQTIRWRSQRNIDNILLNGEFSLSDREISKGKTCFIGYDKKGQPINYISVKDHIRSEFPLDSTERLTIFTMETGRELVRQPIERVTVIFDMTDFSLKNMDYQHVQFIVELLEKHYPESLGLGLVVNAPWIFNSCWLLIRSWLDPVVESKIRFIKRSDQLLEFIDRSVLPKHLNGDLDKFIYLPPTIEDRIMFDRFHSDIQGKQRTEYEHSNSFDQFIDLTKYWTENFDISIELQRLNSIEILRKTFEKRIPYLRTRTHYHRTKILDDKIFFQTFQHLTENKIELDQETFSSIQF